MNTTYRGGIIMVSFSACDRITVRKFRAQLVRGILEASSITFRRNILDDPAAGTCVSTRRVCTFYCRKHFILSGKLSFSSSFRRPSLEPKYSIFRAIIVSWLSSSPISLHNYQRVPSRYSKWVDGVTVSQDIWSHYDQF